MCVCVCARVSVCVVCPKTNCRLAKAEEDKIVIQDLVHKNFADLLLLIFPQLQSDHCGSFSLNSNYCSPDMSRSVKSRHPKLV